MKKWLAGTFICAYLGALTVGFLAHLFSVGILAHPGMYFIVWDMFCGWSAHSSEIHVIAEGESGDFYRLTPAPWGEFVPFATLERQHYDVNNLYAAKMGVNTLRHTAHEEMMRILVIEESWPKKFNLPQQVWDQNYAEAKDVYKYCRVRAEFEPDGTIVGRQNSWLEHLAAHSLMDNPRLKADSQRGKTPYILDPARPQSGPSTPTAFAPANLAPNAQ